MRRLPSNRGRMLAAGCDLYTIFGKRGTNELRIELPRSEPVTRCFILITSMLWSPTGFKTEREILYKRYESVVKLMCSPGGDRVDLTDVWGCVRVLEGSAARTPGCRDYAPRGSCHSRPFFAVTDVRTTPAGPKCECADLDQHVRTSDQLIWRARPADVARPLAIGQGSPCSNRCAPR